MDLRYERVIAVMTEKDLKPGQVITVTIVRDEDNIFVARTLPR